MKRLFGCLLVLALLLSLTALAQASSGVINVPKVHTPLPYRGWYLEGVEYGIEYDREGSTSEVNAGTYQTTVTPKENYTWEDGSRKALTLYWVIEPKALPAIASLAYTTIPYDGSAKTPAVTITDVTAFSVTLQLGRDFTVNYQNNTDVGTATVTATGIGNYTGTRTATFVIARAALPKITSLSAYDYPYDGTAKTPTVAIEGLSLGKDFSVSYQNNTDVGTATVSATGMGSYTGVSTAKFDITHTHVWGTWTSNDDGTHSGDCTALPVHTDTVDCTFEEKVIPPTCEEGGYTDFTCTVCGYGYLDRFTEPTGHSWGDCLNNNDGTHTCTCKNDPSHQKTEDCTLISAVEPPTCTEEGYTQYTCTLCGYGYLDFFTEPTGHIPGDWELIQKATDLREGEEVRRCLACGIPLAFQSLPKLTHIEGRTATLEGEEFPGMMGRDFRIRYMYVPLDVSQDGVQEVRVIASNRYVIGTLTITVKEGQMMFSFKPADGRVAVDKPYLTLFHDPAAFVKQDLDILMDNPLPLDSWIPLPESAQASYLFLRFRAGFDVPGKEIISLP